MHADVLVIGAGIAGLAAAGELSAAGARVLVLEARTRTGGRICTLHPPQLDVPVELGAEFVHELSDGLRAILERSGVRLIELGGEHWTAEGGTLKRDDALFDRIGDVLATIARQLPPDRSIESALEDVSDVSAEDRRRVRQYIEGYHAADVDRASAQAIVAAEGGGEAPGPAGRQYRLEGGYTSVIRVLCDDVPQAAVVTDARVERIAWRRGAVHVTSSSADGIVRDDTASAAIVPVPIGVLFAAASAHGAIVIEPMPSALAAAARALAMGSALRVALAFREPFWTELRDAHGSSAQRVAFFHTASERLPVWWTQHPRT
ncbi:MAG: flavin monoamine oxidase family protein, partial [Longimicrobiales bacterium]